MEKNLVYTFTFFMIMGSYQRAGKANREKCLAMLCESGIRKTFPILYDKTCLSFFFHFGWYEEQHEHPISRLMD